MLSDEKIKEFIKKDELDDTDVLEIIRRYIYDLKGVDVGEIERPHGMPCVKYTNNGIEMSNDLTLMQIAYLKCLGYYGQKFN